VLPKIPKQVLEAYKPISIWESFYLRTRWRLCPYERVELLLPEKGKILDFGCGYGLLGNLLTLKCPSRSVVGIDLNKKRIRIAERSAKNRKNITFHYGDIERLEIAQFDAVVMTDVLHHIDDSNLKILLENINSRLRSDGILVILDVDKIPFWKFFVAFSIDRLLNPNEQLYFRSMSDMQRLFKPFPLKIEKIIHSHRGLPLSDIIYICKKTVVPHGDIPLTPKDIR